MAVSAGDQEAPAAVRRHVERWADRCLRRMRAHDPERRPVWDRGKFLLELWADAPEYPGAVELADEFERAVREARGMPARFEQSVAALSDIL